MMLLEVLSLSAGYGPITILQGVDLHLDAGEIVCVVGPNGAGKSTLLRVVAGQLFPSSGKVLFDDEDMGRQGIRERGRKGLIFIPQGENVFPTLTVLENLEMAGYVSTDRAGVERGIEKVLQRFPFLGERRERPARELSGGQRQILALSRILILQPRLALLDEPSLGLSPLLVDHVFQEILEMNQKGISLLLVEQNARKGLSVSHRGYVLELGRNRLTGTGEELVNNRDVQRLYLGG